jgi:NAD(P)-dependent dehydrogenase (short-subunit alcohol dehydrogenase family)
VGRLEGRSAIVTGAGQGVGRAIAIKLASEGALVTVAERNEETCAAVAAELADVGAAGLAVVCDVSSRDDVNSAVAQTVAARGGVDILVNNAHDLRNVRTMFLDTSEEHLLRNLRSGLFGAYYFLQACHPYLKERRGAVLNVAAAAGVRGGDGYFAYAATKEALRATTRVVAREFGPDGIRVNAICPVAMDTPTVVAFTGGTMSEAMAESSPLRRVVLARDVADVAFLLLCDESAIITGHTIMADGGLNMDAGR